MTNYGTIPTSTAPQPSLDYISRAKHLGRSALATRRPWKELADFHSFSFPPRSFSPLVARFKTNLTSFSMNYTIILLFVVFVSLIWHPFSLIVFLVCMVAWLFLYFLRDEPLVLFGRTIGDGLVLIFLSVVTLVLLLLTHATMNILIALLVGVVVVLIHAAVRNTEEAYDNLEDYAAAGDR
ncbi:hypothetical protein LUZ60_012350 [Juncus effusus]|nr:hypothetical protein LUZ60_012350 [Juncus effusus]